MNRAYVPLEWTHRNSAVTSASRIILQSIPSPKNRCALFEGQSQAWHLQILAPGYV